MAWGSNPASADIVESEEQQMQQCWNLHEIYENSKKIFLFFIKSRGLPMPIADKSSRMRANP